MKTEIIVIILLTVCASKSFSVQRHVPGQYPTIQAAIDDSQAQDEIIVAPGIYYISEITSPGPMVVDIALCSSGNAANTILDFSLITSDSWIFTLGNSVLDGFTIKNMQYGSQFIADNSIISSCVFSENNTIIFGSSCAFVNCQIVNNYCEVAASVMVDDTNLINCTIANNYIVPRASEYSFVSTGGVTSISNCIFYGNTGYPQNQLIQNSGRLIIDHSCIQGGKANVSLFDSGSSSDSATNWNEGNLDEDPLFYDNTYSLSAGSPCIDKGFNATILDAAIDINGYPRIYNNVVDMGACEYQGNPNLPDESVSFAITSANISASMLMLRGEMLVDNMVGNIIVVRVGDFTGEIDTTSSNFMDLGRLGLFRGSSGISLALFNFSDRTFLIMAQGVNIGALNCPLEIDISLSE